MAKSTPILEWCIVRLGEDFNWWVEEVSDTVHWDTDGLSIIDPRQLNHIIELIEPLRDYGFDPNIVERGFIPFRIDKDLGKNRVRLVRVKESILESEEKLFVLPDIVDDENSSYADLLDHLTRLRVKMLNDLFDFEKNLTVDEIEDELREENNADFMEGKSVHVYTEIVSVLDYTPAGADLDEDDDAPRAKKAEPEEDFPDVEEEDEEALKGDQSLKWDEDEEEKDGEEELDADGKPKNLEAKAKGDDDDEDEDEEEDGDDDKDEEADEDDAPKKKRGRH
jgi:hypothetical protein